MSSSANAVKAEDKKNVKHAQFQWADAKDLFISTKGKLIRKSQKKLDKINQTEILVKKEGLKLNADQEQMLLTKPSLKKEIRELQAEIDFYIKSNPSWDKKNTGYTEE
jgi:hypothetical protein